MSCCHSPVVYEVARDEDGLVGSLNELRNFYGTLLPVPGLCDGISVWGFFGATA